MRKTFTAAALLAASVGGIAAGASAASAEANTDAAASASTERQLPAVGNLLGANPLGGLLGGLGDGLPLGK
ncbi:hypothetical protein ACOBQX_01045 [Actinokineospora sp. G85]|uniref:hypothetical protein n=1 Tax=Actinokineospora sp. G85 TaxID=3406626 RepID=UPI003C782939